MTRKPLGIPIKRKSFLIVPQSGVRSLRRMVHSVGLVLFETPEAARFSSENGTENTTDHAGFDVSLVKLIG